MIVKILLFAEARDLIGTDQVELNFDSESTTKEQGVDIVHKWQTNMKCVLIEPEGIGSLNLPLKSDNRVSYRPFNKIGPKKN